MWLMHDTSNRYKDISEMAQHIIEIRRIFFFAFAFVCLLCYLFLFFVCVLFLFLLLLFVCFYFCVMHFHDLHSHFCSNHNFQYIIFLTFEIIVFTLDYKCFALFKQVTLGLNCLQGSSYWRLYCLDVYTLNETDAL